MRPLGALEATRNALYKSTATTTTTSVTLTFGRGGLLRRDVDRGDLASLTG